MPPPWSLLRTKVIYGSTGCYSERLEVPKLYVIIPLLPYGKGDWGITPVNKKPEYDSQVKKGQIRERSVMLLGRAFRSV